MVFEQRDVCGIRLPLRAASSLPGSFARPERVVFCSGQRPPTLMTRGQAVPRQTTTTTRAKPRHPSHAILYSCRLRARPERVAAPRVLAASLGSRTPRVASMCLRHHLAPAFRMLRVGLVALVALGPTPSAAPLETQVLPSCPRLRSSFRCLRRLPRRQWSSRLRRR